MQAATHTVYTHTHTTHRTHENIKLENMICMQTNKIKNAQIKHHETHKLYSTLSLFFVVHLLLRMGPAFKRDCYT